MRTTFLALAAALMAPASMAAPREVTVSAGSRDRRDTVVSFLLADAAGRHFGLRDTSGRLLPLQVDDSGRAWFVLPSLKAGASTTFKLEPLPKLSPADGVKAARDGDAVDLVWGRRNLLRYQGGPGVLPPDVKPVFRRGGYIHPVSTPSGRVVTGDYAKGHRHHHGLWFSWTKTEYEGRAPDFWNMADLKGTVEFEVLEATWSGPVHGGLRARHRYVDLTSGAPKTALVETWVTRAYGVGGGAAPYTVFDVEVTQVAGALPLVLPQYHYGGAGLRGPDSWLGAENAYFLTSEGKTRQDGNETRGRWAHMSGDVDGQRAGLAVLGHPQNLRAPEPLRLHPTEPFICVAPSQLGRWEIAPGTPHVARYRYVASDGPPDPKELDRLWYDYAEPPQVTVE
jgi:hypothetical protein